MTDSTEHGLHRRALELFDSAIELDLDQQGAFLDAKCRGETELRARVAILLAEHGNTGKLLDRVGAVARSLLTVPTMGAEKRFVALERYDVVAELGRGGMGVVYLARDRQLHREVALKIVQEGVTPTRRRRFEAEARLMASLEHPNIVSLFDFGTTTADELYYTMPVLRGGTLADALQRRRQKDSQNNPSELRRLVSILADAVAGVSHAHERGIVHRDLKPSNIALSQLDEVRVLDWGISKVLAGEEAALDGPQRPKTSTLTHTGEILGTLLYMAPEQGRGEPASTASDVYSLGTILYETLTVTVPFPGRDQDAVLQAHAEVTPQPPSERAPSRSVPKLLESLCLAALAKDPIDRPSTNEMHDGLRAWLNDSADGAAVVAASSDAGDRTQQRDTVVSLAAATAKRQPAVSIAVAVSVAVVALIAGWTRWRPSPRFDGPIPESRLIPGGVFEMGSRIDDEGQFPDEYLHTVTISRPFRLALTEVTREQFLAVMGFDPTTHDCAMDCPVSDVSWFEAIEYCNRLSELTGLEACYQLDDTSVTWPRGLLCEGYRLPTEAEWEFAAKAGGMTRFAGTDSRDDVCAYANVADVQGFVDPDAFACDDGYPGLAPVGQFRANEWGLFDMTGNLYEWVWDWIGDPPREPSIDPLGPDVGTIRATHGGSYRTFYRYQRLSVRGSEPPGNRSNALGFRVARSGQPEP